MHSNDNQAAETPARARRWHFADACLDEAKLEFTVAGEPVGLERKVLEVLQLLLERPDEILTKSEIMEVVWPGRILSESVIAKCISRLREVLKDKDQSVIKTVRGYGYRFVAAVTLETQPAASQMDTALQPGYHPPLRPNWSLVEHLGSGGQGEVWRVQHDKTREQRIFKFAVELAGLKAIKREITLSRYLYDSLGARTDLAQVLDWNLQAAPYFLERPYALGGNLLDWIQAQGGPNQIALPLRLELIAQIADALGAAHTVGVLHKDLKPSNVLVRGGDDPAAPTIQLVDLGSGGLTNQDSLADMGITRLGFTQTIEAEKAGASLLYVAPELLSGHPASIKADLYALGVMLYQCVVGDLSHPLSQGWENHIKDELLCQDIAALVAGDPEQRLGDASELAQRLRTLDQRRDQHKQEQIQQRRLAEQTAQAEAQARQAELRLARLQARRNWMMAAMALLLLGLGVSIPLYFQAVIAGQKAGESELLAKSAEQDALQAAQEAEAVAGFLSRDLFATVGDQPLRDLSVRDILLASAEKLEQRVDDMPGDAAVQLYMALGNALFLVDGFLEAKTLLESALAHSESLHGPGAEPTVAIAVRVLDVERGFAKQWPDRSPRYLRMLGEARKQLGEHHELVLRMRENLALWRFFFGQWQAAAQDLQQLLKDHERFNSSSRIVASTRERMGRIRFYLADFSAAERELRAAVGVLSDELSAEALIKAQAMHTLVKVLAEQNRFHEARQMLEQAQVLTRQLIQDENAGLWISLRLAQGLLDLRAGRAAETVNNYEDLILTILDLPWARITDFSYEARARLALAYLQLGRQDDALQMMQKALDVSLGTLGRQHPISQYILLELAGLRLQRKEVIEAQQILDQVDMAVLESLSADHPIAAELLRVQGLLALAQGHNPQAREALRRANDILTQRYDAQHRLSQRVQQALPPVVAR